MTENFSTERVLSGVLLISFLVAFLVLSVSTFIFARTTAAKFDRRAKQDGLHPIAPIVFFPSGHLTLYAFALILSGKWRNNLVSANRINIEVIDKYKTKGDETKAKLFLGSGCVCLLVILFYC